jgi:hypothetical protein
MICFRLDFSVSISSKQGFKLNKLKWFAILLLSISGSLSYAVDNCAEMIHFASKGLIYKNLPIVTSQGKPLQRQRVIYSNGDEYVYIVNKPQVWQSEPESIKAVIGDEGRFVDDAVAENPGINCHGYACLVNDIPGLPRNSWVDSMPGASNDYTSPMGIILTRYFEPIDSGYFVNPKGLVESERLLAGDYVAFRNPSGIIVHSGIIIKEKLPSGQTVNWVRSKIGEETIVETPFVNLGRAYFNIDSIHIYRRL